MLKRRIIPAIIGATLLATSPYLIEVYQKNRLIREYSIMPIDEMVTLGEFDVQPLFIAGVLDAFITIDDRNVLKNIKGNMQQQILKVEGRERKILANRPTTNDFILDVGDRVRVRTAKLNQFTFIDGVTMEDFKCGTFEFLIEYNILLPYGVERPFQRSTLFSTGECPE